MNERWRLSSAAIGMLPVILLLSSCQRQPESKPRSSAQTLLRREPVFFLKGDGTLSPGAIAKLKTWVDAWGVAGTWTLGCPTGPGLTYELLEKRLLALRTELRRLGVPKVATTLLPGDPPGPYDAIYVLKGPL